MLSVGEDVEASALSRRGWSISAIARHLDRDRKTVRSIGRGAGRGSAAGVRLLAPFAAYVAARFADDPHLWASALFDEVVPLGYDRSYVSFARQLRLAGFRPHCEACTGVGGRETIEISHPAVRRPMWKATYASPPGSWTRTMTSRLSRPSSARRRATYRDTVTSATPAPCSATSRCQTRRAVCRCLRGTSRSLAATRR